MYSKYLGDELIRKQKIGINVVVIILLCIIVSISLYILSKQKSNKTLTPIQILAPMPTPIYNTPKIDINYSNNKLLWNYSSIYNMTDNYAQNGRIIIPIKKYNNNKLSSTLESSAPIAS